MQEPISFPMIIPTTEEDYVRLDREIPLFIEFFDITEIVFIGPETVEAHVREDAKRFGLEDRVRFLDENDLIDREDFFAMIRRRIQRAGYEIAGNSHLGWYYQQFLKLAYADVCDSEYYMEWDADTIPLRRTEMFTKDGHPYFDMKTEHNPGYFKTIKKLFGFGKQVDLSFIAEHMIFSVKYVKEMINEIMHTSFPGDNFYEKIFYAIDLDNLKLGFAEFETYGTWMFVRHPEVYRYREWRSLREASLFIKDCRMTEEDREWLAGGFDAVTFEKYHDLEPDFSKMFYNSQYRKAMNAWEFYDIFVRNGVLGKFRI